MSTATEERVDLSDLDLLDDDRDHGFCLDCAGGKPRPGEVLTALCGVRAMAWDSVIYYDVPPDLCKGCEVVWRLGRCPVCNPLTP
jgi:hypothetical protein